YEILRSGLRTLSIAATGEGKVLVRAPANLPMLEITRAVAQREDWICAHLERIQQRQAQWVRRELSEGELQYLKCRAKEVLPERVRYYGDLMGLAPEAVTITHAKKRLGSCSTAGRICFSCLLMLYPPEAVDYVVVHELAHLVQPNHSAAFYALVERYLPDYRARIQLLKQDPLLIKK
ncbi:MAG: M48 family metallopeptidase, partial [Clostridiales bacterium]|nr:M48 family metallopeptidase [Clostridiales bacterium]